MFHPIDQRLNISIYGAGWLGNPLALLLAENNYQVLATQSSHYPPYFHPNLTYLTWRAQLGENINFWKPLIDADIQIWSIPPRVRQHGEHFYLEILSDWVSKLANQQSKKLVFLSSTSVYAPSDKLITENAEVLQDSLIYKAEQIIMNAGTDHLIIRLGGLMGGERYVAKYYTGKQVDRADGPVNYVHQEDALAFTFSAIHQNVNGIYNLVAPEHPKRKDVILENCRKHQLPPPIQFNENEDAPKIISSEKISEALSKTFQHPNPLYF